MHIHRVPPEIWKIGSWTFIIFTFYLHSGAAKFTLIHTDQSDVSRFHSHSHTHTHTIVSQLPPGLPAEPALPGEPRSGPGQRLEPEWRERDATRVFQESLTRLLLLALLTSSLAKRIIP